ncbi:hypothetical protein EGW08_016408 [Elysia chlorotica]|uniref:Uncharacterized protein n=1 Tax=Elysia chlorotica TaxID=188477 RepID=A0A3S1AZ36_ELYCH|nr:hypothetical protein EGW08_016408 [Elysia chlorotica]
MWTPSVEVESRAVVQTAGSTSIQLGQTGGSSVSEGHVPTSVSDIVVGDQPLPAGTDVVVVAEQAFPSGVAAACRGSGSKLGVRRLGERRVRAQESESVTETSGCKEENVESVRSERSEPASTSVSEMHEKDLSEVTEMSGRLVLTESTEQMEVDVTQVVTGGSSERRQSVGPGFNSHFHVDRGFTKAPARSLDRVLSAKVDPQVPLSLLTIEFSTEFGR